MATTVQMDDNPLDGMDFDDLTERELPQELVGQHILDLPSRRVLGNPQRQRQRIDYSLTYKVAGREHPIPVCGKNKILLIKGNEGSRKSLLASCILMSRFIDDTKYTMGFKLDLEPGEIILHFDTEMDMEETEERKESFNRICSIRHDDPRYMMYNISDYSYQQRIDMINYTIQKVQEEHKIGLIVIDQVADLLRGYNANDEIGANDVLEWLLAWKRAGDCILMPVMHTNRGGVNTNGKLGKWIDHKAFGSLLVTYNHESHETEVQHHKSRKKKIPKFRFHQDEHGNPRFLNDDIGDIFN